MSLRKLTMMCLMTLLLLVTSACGMNSNTSVDQISQQGLAETQALSTLLAADGLKIVGLVDTPTVWTGAEMRAMEMIEVQFASSSGEETVYQGVPIIFLLSLVDVQDQASGIVIKSEKGSETQVMLADLNACIKCIVAPIDEQNFTVILPGIQPDAVITEVIHLVLE